MVHQPRVAILEEMIIKTKKDRHTYKTYLQTPLKQEPQQWAVLGAKDKVVLGMAWTNLHMDLVPDLTGLDHNGQSKLQLLFKKISKACYSNTWVRRISVNSASNDL